MKLYMVAFDLHNARNYELLYQFFTLMRAVRVLDSTWLLRSTADAGALMNAMRRYSDRDDAFAVVEIVPGADWATAHVPPAPVLLLRHSDAMLAIA